jgi:uncharacterized protein (TIGR02271 family)
MAQRNGRKQTLPVAEERLRVGKRKVETGRVRVSTRTEERQQAIREELLREEVAIERVRIDRFSDTEPQMRQDGDVLIVPVFEEVLVKRILVREELRITRKRRVDEVEELVTLKRQNVVVERTSRR